MELFYIKVEVTSSHDEKSKQTQLGEVTQGLVQSRFDHLQIRDSTSLAVFYFRHGQIEQQFRTRVSACVSCFSSSHFQGEFGSIIS